MAAKVAAMARETGQVTGPEIGKATAQGIVRATAVVTGAAIVAVTAPARVTAWAARIVRVLLTGAPEAGIVARVSETGVPALPTEARAAVIETATVAADATTHSRA